MIEIEGPPPLEQPADVVIEALSGVVTAERFQRIERVVSGRTDDVVVVLDGISDPHNSSAVLRSADAFGIQSIHVIAGPHGFRASQGVSKGTHRWLDIVRHRSAEACASHLKEAGFALYAAQMDASITPGELGLIPRVAVIFGNEHRGVSPAMLARTDGAFSIPMRGFVESLNVSVAAAITMHALADQGRQPLSPARVKELQARFLMNSVKNAETVIARFLGNA